MVRTCIQQTRACPTKCCSVPHSPCVACGEIHCLSVSLLESGLTFVSIIKPDSRRDTAYLSGMPILTITFFSKRKSIPSKTIRLQVTGNPPLIVEVAGFDLVGFGRRRSQSYISPPLSCNYVGGLNAVR